MKSITLLFVLFVISACSAVAKSDTPNRNAESVIAEPSFEKERTDDVRITYIRERAWGGLVSHLVFSDRTGRVIGVSDLSRALSISLSNDIVTSHVEDTRTAEEARAAEKAVNLDRDRSSASQVEEIRDIFRNSGKVGGSSTLKSAGGARCEIECAYLRELAYNKCENGKETGVAVCELGEGGGIATAPFVLDCKRRVFSEFQRCKDEGAKAWRRCAIRCTFETIPN